MLTSPPNTSEPSEKPHGSLAKNRVLVIDDDRKLCRLIHDYLEPMGYVVESAHTGPEGLDKARSGAYQVVIIKTIRAVGYLMINPREE